MDTEDNYPHRTETYPEAIFRGALIGLWAATTLGIAFDGCGKIFTGPEQAKIEVVQKNRATTTKVLRGND